MSSETPVRTKPWDFGLISTSRFGELEREYVLRVLDRRRVFRYLRDQGESECRQLEELYESRLDRSHALAVNSGTSALICALIGAGIGPGDEVIVPGYTYIATAAAVLAARAVPVIVEVDDSLTMDPDAMEAAITPHTAAIIPVHMRGVPCQMDRIMEVAARHELIVIEDVAQANGGSFRGRALGSFGDFGCFSFQQYKIATAGEGGLVATDSADLHSRALMHHDSAMAYWGAAGEGIPLTRPGETYRLSELNAALALAQVETLDEVIAQLREVKGRISKGIEDLEGLRLQRIPDSQGDISTSLIFFVASAADARSFSAQLQAEGIPNGTIGGSGFPDRHVYRHWDYVLAKRGISEKDNPWSPSVYKGDVEYSPDMCPQTLDLLGRAVVLELHPDMTDEHCDDAVTAIRKVARRR